MSSIKATIVGRRLEVDVPPDWADGTQVEIHPLSNGAPAESDLLTSDEIGHLLTAMDQMEPLDMSDAERAAWDARRQARKEWEKSQFALEAERLRRSWD